MTQPSKYVFTDHEIAPQIISLLDQSREWVVIVTPYLKLETWGHVKNEIQKAIKGGVRITFLVRGSEERVSHDDINWLLTQKVRVLEVENLHAKIYMSEKSTIVSSMNLHTFSAQNSREIALFIRSRDDVALVQSYVKDELMKIAKPVKSGDTQPTKPRRTAHVVETGFCLRCRSVVLLDTDRPLCTDCYNEWAEYENEDYTERYCHLCGSHWDTSYARPLCRPCYDRVTR